jgi:alcohol dehydrogenase (cytochrome c)
MAEKWALQQRAPFLTPCSPPPAAWRSSAISIARSRPWTRTRQDPVVHAAGHVGAGLPISFSVDGRQYIAVTTGLGGGSPRLVPSTLAPEIRVPTTGQALYVFALPEKKVDP